MKADSPSLPPGGLDRTRVLTSRDTGPAGQGQFGSRSTAVQLKIQRTVSRKGGLNEPPDQSDIELGRTPPCGRSRGPKVVEELRQGRTMSPLLLFLPMHGKGDEIPVGQWPNRQHDRPMHRRICANFSVRAAKRLAFIARATPALEPRPRPHQ